MRLVKARTCYRSQVFCSMEEVQDLHPARESFCRPPPDPVRAISQHINLPTQRRLGCPTRCTHAPSTWANTPSIEICNIHRDMQLLGRRPHPLRTWTFPKPLFALLLLGLDIGARPLNKTLYAARGEPDTADHLQLLRRYRKRKQCGSRPFRGLNDMCCVDRRAPGDSAKA
jgi:hypothetical protein